MAETTQRAVTPKQPTRQAQVGATPDPVEHIIGQVAAGRRSVDRAWHQLRGAAATLEQWQEFAAVCCGRGRKYDGRWARHQYNCWTLESNAGTYPQQRAQWLLAQADFAQRMKAKAGNTATGRVLTNAQLRANRHRPAPAPDHTQLALFA